MNREKTFQIYLNPDYIQQFSESLDKHEHISEHISFVEKAFKGRMYGDVLAWDCICTCVHRIRSGVEYLNAQKLGKMEFGNAFDFINFINNASVVLDCIRILADILGVDLSKEDSRTAIFKMTGNDGKGTDKSYFEFIRSICAVHPAETNRHKRYHGAKLATCPFLVWVHTMPTSGFWNCDIHANALVNEENSWGKNISIHVDQVFAYIKFRYSLLNKIGNELERYQESKIEEFRNTPIPDRLKDESEIDFLKRLKQIEIKRFGSNNDFVYDFAEKVLTFKPSNADNNESVQRYANAWRFAISLQLNVLRDMSREGLEHAGIADDDSDWILFEQLDYCHCNCEELSGFGYNLEKLGYLDGTSEQEDALWGRMKLKEMDGVLGEHVTFDYENDTDEELYILAHVALYEICL